jgi:N-acetylneuraminate synthase
MIGEDGKDLSNELAARKHARRSIVATRNLRAGEILSSADLICKRPAHGISPIHWDEVIGRRVIVDVEEDSILQWEMLSSDQSK